MFYNFKKWLNDKVGIANPVALTSEEWDKHEIESHQKSQFVYWFNETFLYKLEKAIEFIPSKCRDVKIFIKNTFHHSNKLKTKLPIGQYQEVETLFLYGIFETFVDFIEIEKAWMQVIGSKDSKYKVPFWRKHYWFNFVSWRCKEAGLEHLIWESKLINEPEYGGDGELSLQAISAIEQLALYKWWTEVRPNREDPYDEVTKVREQYDQIYGSTGPFEINSKWPKEAQEHYKQELLKVHDKEEAHYNEDNEMLIRLIKIRNHLWT